MEIDERTKVFRQQLGLLVSKHWNHSEFEDDNHIPVKLVSRHLQQRSADNVKKDLQTGESMLKSDKSLVEQQQELSLDRGQGSSKKRRHPGCVTLSILQTTPDSSNNSSSAVKTTPAQEIFLTTCKTCFGPIHPGSSTTTDIRVESSKQSKGKLSKSQKRKRRRYRKALYQEAEQRSKQAKTQQHTPDFAEWYRYASDMDHRTTRSFVCDPDHALLCFSCTKCLTPACISLTKPLLPRPVSSGMKNKAPNKPSIFGNAAVTKTSTPRKTEPSQPFKKNGDVGDDYIAFDKPARPTMQSAVKPKKKKGKKKKGGGGSQLRDFLSSLNDH